MCAGRGPKLIILPLPAQDLLALRHQLLRGDLYLTPVRVPVTLYARAALAVRDARVTVSATGGGGSRGDSGDQQAGEDKDDELRHLWWIDSGHERDCLKDTELRL